MKMAYIQYFLYRVAYGLQTIFTFLFLGVFFVKAICNSDPNLLCCSDSVWDYRIGNCIDCSDGYSGINCSDFCRFPSYGKGCQSLCACSAEFCNPSTGCTIQTSFGVALTSYETTPGQGKVTTLSTTLATAASSNKDTESHFSNRISSTQTNSKTTYQSHIPESEQNISLDDRGNVNVLLLSGIFGFCGIFVILFSVLVIIQVKYKCCKIGQDITISDGNQLSSVQIKGMYTKYNEETEDAVMISHYQQPTNASSDLESPPQDLQYIDLERYQNEGLLDSAAVPQRPAPCVSAKTKSHLTGNEGNKFPEYIEVIDFSEDHGDKQCFTSCETGEIVQSVYNEEAEVYLTVMS